MPDPATGELLEVEVKVKGPAKRTVGHFNVMPRRGGVLLTVPSTALKPLKN
jgi:hypothetical protein